MLLPYKSSDKFLNFSERFGNLEFAKVSRFKTCSYLLFAIVRSLTVTGYTISTEAKQTFNKYFNTERFISYGARTAPSTPLFNLFTSKRQLLRTNNMNFNFKVLIGKQTHFYLEHYFSLLIHNYLLKKVNSNRVFSLYPVKDNHFNKTCSFAPPIENIVKFKKFIFKGKYTSYALPSIFLLKIHFYTTNARHSCGIKSFYTSFFKDFTRFKSLLKHKGLKFKFFSIRKTAYRINYNLNKLLTKRLRYLSFLYKKSTYAISNAKKKIILKKLKRLSNINTIYKANISTSVLSFRKKQDFNSLKKQNFSLSLPNVKTFSLHSPKKLLSLLLFFKSPLHSKCISMLKLLHGK
jgi:hypothetical protein